MTATWPRANIAHTMLSRRNSIFACYLFPRVFPLLLVVLLTFKFGPLGLGEVALVLSIISFLSLATDWGVSQWLLLRPEVSTERLRIILTGRFVTTLLAVCASLVSTVWISLNQEQLALLLFGVAASFFQSAFAFYIHGGRYKTALLIGFIEYAVPPLAVLTSSTPVEGLAVALVFKCFFGASFFVTGLRRVDKSIKGGLPPNRFGTNHALWALTSIGGGTGEMLALSTLGPSLSGPYRLMQTAGSAGSIIGAAVQAPLMGSSKKPWTKRRLLLGGLLLIVASIGAALVATVILQPWHGAKDQSFIYYTVPLLLFNCALSSLAILPATALARRHGSRPLLISGIASALVYWILIAIILAFNLLYFVPWAPILSTLIGLLMNLVQLKGRTH